MGRRDKEVLVTSTIPFAMSIKPPNPSGFILSFLFGVQVIVVHRLVLSFVATTLRAKQSNNQVVGFRIGVR